MPTLHELLLLVLLLVLLLPVVYAANIFIVAGRLWRIRIGRSIVEGAPPDTLPAHVAAVIAGARAELEVAGLTARQVLRLKSSLDPSYDVDALEMAGHDGRLRAILQASSSVEEEGVAWLSLVSCDASGRQILTTSFYPSRLLPPPAHVEAEMMAGAGVKQLLEHHAARLASSGMQPVAVDARGAVDHLQRQYDMSVEDFRRSGRAFAAGDERLGWKLLPGIAKAIKLLWREQARARLARRTRAARRTELPLPVLHELDCDAYRRHAAHTGGQAHWQVKAVVMALALIAAGLALGWVAEPVTVLCIFGVLLVHECGHLAAMAGFGHRDAYLFFMPFFGTKPLRRDAQALEPWKEIVIILAGPLPGLFLGIAVMSFWGDAPEWVRIAAFGAIAFNAINLLPVLPLDGGHILRHTFTLLWPRLRPALAGLSGCALIALGLWADSPLFVFLAAVLFWKLPLEWRRAELVTEMRRASLPSDAGGIARAVLLKLRGPEWARLPGVRRVNLARTITRELARPIPNNWTVLLAAVGYTSPFWLGPALMVAGSMARDRSLLARAERPPHVQTVESVRGTDPSPG